MQTDQSTVLSKTRLRPDRCPACGGRGWRLDLDERCDHCNPCCEEHYPSEAMTPVEQAEHVCPNCSWEANPEWHDLISADGRQSWWPDYVDSPEGVARYCRAVEAEPHNVEALGAVSVARTVAEMLECLSASIDRCNCCRVPLTDEEDRAVVAPIDGGASWYCTGCWSDIQDAIKAQVDLMSRSLY